MKKAFHRKLDVGEDSGMVIARTELLACTRKLVGMLQHP